MPTSAVQQDDVQLLIDRYDTATLASCHTRASPFDYRHGFQTFLHSAPQGLQTAGQLTTHRVAWPQHIQYCRQSLLKLRKAPFHRQLPFAGDFQRLKRLFRNLLKLSAFFLAQHLRRPQLHPPKPFNA